MPAADAVAATPMDRSSDMPHVTVKRDFLRITRPPESLPQYPRGTLSGVPQLVNEPRGPRTRSWPSRSDHWWEPEALEQDGVGEPGHRGGGITLERQHEQPGRRGGA